MEKGRKETRKEEEMKLEGKRKGGRDEKRKGGMEESRKSKGDVIPNFTNLEALQLQTWDAAALVFCFT